MSMTRIILAVVGIGLVAGLGFAIDSRSRGPASPRTIDWTAEYGRICAPGIVSGKGDPIELRPQIAGKLVRLYAAEGDLLEAGDPILQIDDAEYRHQVALAESQLAEAKAQLEKLLAGARPEEVAEARAVLEAKRVALEHARMTWERVNRLAAEQSVSRQQADDRKADVDRLEAEVAAAQASLELIESPPRAEDVAAARAKVAAAESQLELAKVRLARTVLKAPVACRVLDIHCEPGELIGPESPLPAVVVADTSSLFVKAFVEEFDAPRVKEDMAAEITAEGLPGRKFRGRVVRCSPRLETKAFSGDRPGEQYDLKTREVWIEIETPKDALETELVVGLPVDVTLFPQTEESEKSE